VKELGYPTLKEEIKRRTPEGRKEEQFLGCFGLLLLLFGFSPLLRVSVHLRRSGYKTRKQGRCCCVWLVGSEGKMGDKSWMKKPNDAHSISAYGKVSEG